MTDSIFRGIATALITPFRNGEVDYDTFGRLIDWQIENGIDALVICGTTGEGSTLSDEEHKACIRFAVERAAGRTVIIAGTGSNDTNYAINLTKYSCDVGADAMLVVTPYYNKATQRGLVESFYAIADASTKPMIVYNVPSRTGVNLLPQTVRRLAEHENIVGVKEASGDIAQVAKIAALCPELAIYSGNDDYVVPVLSLGGKGVISVVSNLLPALMHQMAMDYLQGRCREAMEVQLRILPLVSALFSEVNPIPVKTALGDMGYDCGPLRLPLIEMQPNTHAELLRQLRAFGLVE